MATRLRALFSKATANGKASAATVAAAAGLTGAIGVSTTLLSDDVVHPMELPWQHLGLFASYDHASLRRGFQVYRQVCATCHSLEGIHWRELAGVTHEVKALKEMAAEVDYVDGPNDEGEMFERPGAMSDPLPKPYENDEQGRNANGGALPPDLTLMVKARHAGQDYLFSLLTGYCDPPAGKPMLPGLYYNPYFPGGAIAMPPPLSDDGIEYDDGTPATISQQAKDITQFLNWASEPEANERKKNALIYMTALAFAAIMSGYYKRFKWSPYKTRQITYVRNPQLK